MTLLRRYCLFVVSIFFISAIAECAADDEDGSTTGRPPKNRKYTIEEDEIPDFDLSYPNCGFTPPKLPDGNAAETKKRSSRSAELLRSDVVKHSNILGIVGGDEAERNSWPWMVALHRNEWREADVCGASLISSRYVLTAAHCCEVYGDRDRKHFRLMLGSHDKEDGTAYYVEEVLVHPDYNNTSFENDLCLLKVNVTVKMTEKVYPVCLPSSGIRDKIEPEQTMVTLTGWGHTSNDATEDAEVLQEVEVNILDLDHCYNIFQRNHMDRVICTGKVNGTKGDCQGDSGGPVVAKLNDDSWLQVGTVSFTALNGCGIYPSVSSRISQFSKWICKNSDLCSEKK